jgi:hypothetical protein
VLIVFFLLQSFAPPHPALGGGGSVAPVGWSRSSVPDKKRIIGSSLVYEGVRIPFPQ